ncbi:pyridoxamine 5'-phosphate oxidase [Ereboglobus sp. PH5-5]|uniref:pyridoxamine 5'-phosphate oxidase n=1 Tax=unclassified Ereboglobus TaxID=2626932 RepID=UPI0024075467|nr:MULTISPECIES: pyridoxamine 5'-phosphate oxidase [unclassified Ereboglobus]MDF9828371.1 pyridoxamine 5'-phosphate oxidase [Ereboglobus sp. PH5-10]MDF9833662.1 pyridoxamine 5'-phosphate oxidase [Ereboglobus sp. PH5-5]
MPDTDNNDPIALFKKWQDDAARTKTCDPTAMAVATTDAQGRPSVRVVLLKALDERGFVFYTNLDSPKAADLRAHPRAALCFHWHAIDRQVRIEGPVEPVADAEADAYFATRARLSQIGAWASKQSRPMEGYWELEKAVAATLLRFPIGSVPRPPNWSGFRVKPLRIEFWWQKPFRHHQRFAYERPSTDAPWGGEQWLYP